MSPGSSIVERMYRTLVDEIRENRPELLSDSFTVAEIYQKLVPYRTHRDRIGADMNGDYEHALLRLLAGEGGFVELESDAARRRLREELESIHPDTGLYRNFAACEVHLDGKRLSRLSPEPEALSGSNGEPTGGSEERRGAAADVETRDAAPEDRNGAASPAAVPPRETAGEVTAGAEPEAEQPSEASPEVLPGTTGETTVVSEAEGSAEENGAACAWCRESLPDREDLRYCPFCGSRADLRPCPDCGAEVEPEWIFCVSCGAEAGG